MGTSYLARLKNETIFLKIPFASGDAFVQIIREENTNVTIIDRNPISKIVYSIFMMILLISMVIAPMSNTLVVAHSKG